MIGTIDIKVNAAKPNFPLSPFYSFINSPSQVRIINVPKAIGKWAVTAVQITANYPDNTSRSVSCTLVGGCWSATLPASTAVGQSLMGFKVTASGTDESGAAVTGYVLGKGDVFILNDDSTITIGSTTYYIHLHDTVPQTPQKADLCLINGAWKIYNGTAWIGFGGGTGDISHSEFADMTADLDADESSLGDVMTKVNTLITKLKGTTAAIVALLALGSFAAVEVQTAKLSTLPGKTMIVTNVVGAAAASDLTTATNVLATAITNKADKSEMALKQDALTPAGTNAVTSGITSGKVATYDGYATNKADVTALAGYLPKTDFNTATNTLTSVKRDKMDLTVYKPGIWRYTFTGRDVPGAMTQNYHLVLEDNGWCVHNNLGRCSDWKGNSTSTDLFWESDDSWLGGAIYGVSLRAVRSPISAGYNLVTNAYTKSEADDRYLKLSGGDVYGDLNIIDEGLENYKIQLSTGSSSGPSISITDRDRENPLSIYNRYFHLEGDGVNCAIYFPEKTGTFALLDDIPTNHVSQSTVGGQTLDTAEKILSSAENTAGTIATNVVDAADTNYIVTNAVVALNQSKQSVEVAAGASLTIMKPSGTSLDWIVYAHCAADNTPLILPSGNYYADDTSVTNVLKAGVTALYFTSCGTNGIDIARKELKPFTIP